MQRINGISILCIRVWIVVGWIITIGIVRRVIAAIVIRIRNIGRVIAVVESEIESPWVIVGCAERVGGPVIRRVVIGEPAIRPSMPLLVVSVRVLIVAVFALFRVRAVVVLTLGLVCITLTPFILASRGTHLRVAPWEERQKQPERPKTCEKS